MSSKKLRAAVILGSMAVVGFTGTAVGRGLLQDSSTVTPPAWGSAIASTSGNTMVFSVEADNGNDPFGTEFDFSCDQTTGGLTCTNVSPLGAFLDPGQSTNVTVTYSTSSQTGTGSIRLESKAVGGASNYGTGYVTVDPAVTVTSKSVPSSVMQYAEDDTATFDVKNETGSSKTYTFTCEWGGPSCTAPSSTSIGGGATKTVSVAFDAGDIPATFALKLTATSGGDSDSDEEDVTVTDHLSVNATAERTPVYAEPNVVHTDTFEVRFAGQTAETFTMGVSCPGGGTEVRSCSVVGGTSKSVGDTPVAVAIQYTAGANGDTSTIELTATRASDGDVAVTGELDVVSTSDILLTVDDANYGLEIDQSTCLQISAGPGSIACDTYRHVYPFTPVTRMNRTRQIGLIHDSRMRGPVGVIGANLVLPPGVTEPDSIKATLVVNGTTIGTQSYVASLYVPGERTRLAFVFSNWSHQFEKLLSYDVTVQPWVAGSPQTSETVSGKFLSLNHKTRYSRARWIAGLENLAVLGDTLLWTGADAGGRVYLKSGTRWIGQTRGVPDTIVASGSNYVRHINGGGEVHFNSVGDNTKTVDRNGNETLFTFAAVQGWNRLTTVELPVPGGGADTVYTIHYDAVSGGMDSVRVRSGSGGWDTYRLYTNEGGVAGNEGLQLDSIVAPDGQKTSYQNSHGKLLTIYGPAGDTTAITYLNYKVATVTLKTADVADVAMTYRAASRIGRGTSGWTAPAPVEEVFSRFDGPLAGDTTAFYVTAWGAVRGIRDALGNETWIDREDEDFPGLPTRVRYPNGREVESVYQSDGLLDYTLDRSTGGLTDYAWKESVARPDTIVSPEGVETVFTYDSDGNRLTEKVVGGQATTYTYDADGLLVRVKDGLANRDTLVYDSLGNLERQKTPLNKVTRYERDYLGRVIETVAPDSMRTAVTYDVMGRVVIEEKTNDTDDHWTRLHTTYDSASGLRIEAQAYGDTTTAAQDSMNTAVQEWTYDGLGRVTVQRSGPKADTMAYDLAGQVTQVDDNRGYTTTMEYDVLGRLTERAVEGVTYTNQSGVLDSLPFYSSSLSIPADTVTYTYDAMGNALTINNSRAQITRTYTPDGLLLTDKQAIKNYNSGSFGTHVYELSYAYDRDRRRVSLEHPTWLSPGTDRTAWTYDSQGRVTTITSPNGDEFDYTYDDANRVEERSFPGAGVGGTVWAYDDDNRLTSHRVIVGTDTMLYNSMQYDDVGRVTDVGGDNTSDTYYTGLGSSRETSGLAWEGDWKFEEFVMDPFGSQLRNVSIGGEIGADSTAFENTLDTYGRVVSTVEEWASDQQSNAPSEWEGGFTDYQYDAAGNRKYTRQDRHTWSYTGSPPNLIADKQLTFREESRSFYSADGKLMVHQVNRDSIDYTDTISGEIEGNWGAYEEYWYDGLGRRVLKRSRQDSPHCEITARCYSSIERIVWDGDQILWEVRQAGSGDTKNPGSGDQTGEIGYIHSADVDAPVGMMRNGTTIVLHQSWRGLYAFSTDTSGDPTTCTPEPGVGCTSIAWPAGNNSTFQWNDYKKTQYWYGSLPMDQRDATGLSYRRNRYYDPVSGQFTQTDPIGIAGGLNTYGYAGGDPINFSDPFGLWPCGEVPCFVSMSLQGAAMVGAAGAYAGATGGSLVAPGVGTVSGAAGLGALGAAGGFAVGGAIGGLVDLGNAAASLKADLGRRARKVVGIVGSALSFAAGDPEPPPQEEDPPPVAPVGGQGQGTGPRPSLDDGFTLPDGTTIRFVPRGGGG